MNPQTQTLESSPKGGNVVTSLQLPVSTTPSQATAAHQQGLMSQADTTVMDRNQLRQNDMMSSSSGAGVGALNENVPVGMQPQQQEQGIQQTTTLQVNQSDGNTFAMVPGMVAPPPQGAPFDKKSETIRQQKLDKINQLKQMLEAAQLEEQQYTSQTERIKHMEVNGGTSGPNMLSQTLKSSPMGGNIGMAPQFSQPTAAAHQHGLLMSPTNTMAMNGNHLKQNMATSNPYGAGIALGQNVAGGMQPQWQMQGLPQVNEGNAFATVPGMVVAQQPRAPFDYNFETMRQQNLERIKQCKQILEAAQQLEQQYISQPERITHMEVDGITSGSNMNPQTMGWSHMGGNVVTPPQWNTPSQTTAHQQGLMMSETGMAMGGDQLFRQNIVTSNPFGAGSGVFSQNVPAGMQPQWQMQGVPQSTNLGVHQSEGNTFGLAPRMVVAPQQRAHFDNNLETAHQQNLEKIELLKQMLEAAQQNTQLYTGEPEKMSHMEENPMSLIPSKFTVTDENYKERVIKIGESDNESQEVGTSATQNAKSYVFSLGNDRIRLIDTPGIGDTRGAEQDNKNFENLLVYLGEFKYLHAICILLKPNNARITVMFEYCIKQLLSRLEKSASENIIFLFTNSRSTFYRPGDTLPPLRKILEGTETKSPFVKIPLEKQNIFCIDNEAFRFLIALKHKIKFSEREKEDFASSWQVSSEECLRLLTYISDLKPHKVQNTISVNEARRLIVQLSQPLAETANLIQLNIVQLQRHQEQLDLYADDMEKLKGNLYVPVTNIRVQELEMPRTVCTDLKCCEVYQVNGNKTYHYKQVCHSPCYLENVPKEIVGSPELIKCYAINSSQYCDYCGCSYLAHMHIYYESHTYEDNIVDENVNSQIKTKGNAKKAAEQVLKDIEKRRKEYEQEQNTINKCTAKFASFLQNNAITAYNDAYQSYLEYLIDREKSLGSACDKKNVQNFQNMLRQYIEEKKALDSALADADRGNISASYIRPQDVMASIQQLYSLPHNGRNIKDMFDKQNYAKSNENYTEREVHFNNNSRKNKKVKPVPVPVPKKSMLPNFLNFLQR